MNPNIESLYQLAKKPTRTIVGLMSGTSLDGLDVVLCEISGAAKKTIVAIKEFETIPYSEEVKTVVIKNLSSREDEAKENSQRVERERKQKRKNNKKKSVS